MLAKDDKCKRLIRYGYLFNDLNKSILKLQDIANNDALRLKCEKEYQNLYTLKYDLEDLSQETILKALSYQITPHLESDLNIQ
jgi:hypothetical protein